MEAHVLGPEHLVQDAGEDVLAGVLLHFVKTPFPVDAAGNSGAGNSAFRQSVHAVPEDAVALVHIGHIQRGAVRQGQGAPVGGLTAALRVKHCAVQRNAPAAGLFVRLCGKDDALTLGAEGVRFKVFFCALHGTSKNPLSHRCAMPAPPKGELFLWRESKTSGLKAPLTKPSSEAPPSGELARSA